MSSSNIHSTVNFSSPSSVELESLSLPSVFELLAEERLSELFRPCLRQIVKFIHDLRPSYRLLRILYKYKDELILLIEGITQWLYLNYYSALIGERFYGLKRTADNRLRSLIISVLLPYVKQKLEGLAQKMSNDNNRRRTYFYVFLKLLPKIEIFIEGICWLYRLGYAFGRTQYYSPSLQLAGVKLIYTQVKSPKALPTSGIGRLFSLMNQVMSGGLFLIQFADWLNNATGFKRKLPVNLAFPPLPGSTKSQSTVPRGHCPLCRQLLNMPTAISGSGYVYCQKCIHDYVTKYNRCPTTHQPVIIEQLIKMY